MKGRRTGKINEIKRGKEREKRNGRKKKLQKKREEKKLIGTWDKRRQMEEVHEKLKATRAKRKRMKWKKR